jgi:catechol 2,3-dioxygenase-like lactoylglutathione lyase family enzyme
MTVEKISAVTFRVANRAFSVRFYRDVLGMELVYGGVGVRRGVAKAGWNLGQFRAVLATDHRPLGALRMKIVSQCREQAGGE